MCSGKFGALFDTFDKTVSTDSLPGRRRWVEGVQAACSVVRVQWCFLEFHVKFDRPVADRQTELKDVSFLRAVLLGTPWRFHRWDKLFLPVGVGKTVEIPQEQFLDKLFMPFAVGKPVEIPQVQFLDKVSMLVVVAAQMCRKLCSSTVARNGMWRSFRELDSRRPATCTLVVRLLRGWISLVWTDTCAL